MSFTRGRMIAEMALKDGRGRKTEQEGKTMNVKYENNTVLLCTHHLPMSHVEKEIKIYIMP